MGAVFKTFSRPSAGAAIRLFICGDSYANGDRFGSVAEAFEAAGLSCAAYSLSLPGATSGKIASRLTAETQAKIRSALDGEPNVVLIVSGVNDIIQGVGTEAYTASLQAMAQVFPDASAFVLAIPKFNYLTDPSQPVFRIRNLLRRSLFDREPYPLDRYHRAARATGLPVIPGAVRDYDPASYRDGVHLTEADFADLAARVAAEMVARVAA